MNYKKPIETSLGKKTSTHNTACRPKVLATAKDNAGGAKSKEFSAVKKVVNHNPSGVGNRKQLETASELQNSSKKFGCKPKVLPSKKENINTGLAKELKASKKADLKPWDLNGKLKLVTTQLKEMQEKEKELKHKICETLKEMEEEEKKTERTLMMIPDENTIKEREMQVKRVSQEENVAKLMVDQKQEEKDSLLKTVGSLKSKLQEIENTENETKEVIYKTDEMLLLKENEILKAKWNMKELDCELETVMENYRLLKSTVESQSSKIEFMEDIAKRMENGDLSAFKGLGKHLLETS